MAPFRFQKKMFVVVFIVFGGMLLGVIAGTYLALTHDLPQIRSLEDFRPSAVTRIYSADQVLLSELFVQKRDPIPLEAIPDYLKSALIATEDRNFYKHSGVDLKGIARAIVKDIRAGKFVEGASTISQQLAKTLFLTPRKNISRKLKEALLALHLERRYTKDEILTLYLNQVYFGSGAYGVKSAARIFFGKPVQDLTLAECALIAAMPKAPSRYSPLVDPTLARKRRNIVLKQMRDTGIIHADVYKQAVREAVRVAPQEKTTIKAPHFVAYVVKTLEDELGSILYKGGLKIETTLSSDLQVAAEQAVLSGLLVLERRQPKSGDSPPDAQAALIALDVESGKILAMVGGKDFDKSPFNRASDAIRQPGSAFKPIVYALAVERGFSQNRLLLDAPILFKDTGTEKDWRPENFSRSFSGEMTMRRALALSKNIPVVRLIETLGPASVAEFAARLGIKSTMAPNLSLALGTSEMSLLELTSAYAVFPNRGRHISPFGVTQVLDHDGRVLWRASPQSNIAMSRSTAAITTDMLAAVIHEGTAKKARFIKRPIAGKTGTTNDFKDALFVGFSPSTAVGVWVGRDDFSTLGRGETGARAALPIWTAFMKQAVLKWPYRYFDMPDDVVQISIDPLTGRQANAGATGSVAALFKKGAIPAP